MFLILCFVVLFLFVALASIAMGLLMVLGAAFVAFLIVTLMISALAAWKGEG